MRNFLSHVIAGLIILPFVAVFALWAVSDENALNNSIIEWKTSTFGF